MKQSKRLAALILSGLMVLFLVGCQKGSEEFDAFIQEEFVNTMESDYATAHIFMEHPENFGVDMDAVEVNMGTRLDEATLDEALEGAKERYQEFKSFSRRRLTPAQQELYDLYDDQAQLTLALSDEKFDYYQQLFESMGGIQYQLSVVFADWNLRNEQDVQDLITLMQDVKPYVDSVLDYTRRQQAKGLLMVDLDSVIEHCDTILRSGENSAVLASFNESIEELNLKDGALYKEQLKTAFAQSFLPAYQAIRDTMEEFKAGPNNEEGLAKFENGKEYFELLMQKNVGSHKSVEEIRRMMEKAYEMHLMKLGTILQKHPEVMDVFIKGNLPETDYISYEDILQGVEAAMQEDFPMVGDMDYVIKDVNPEIASSNGIAAYFNIPPLDGTEARQLRVNPLNAAISSLDTYTTVTHEGFPGHMYQYAYAFENLDSPYRKILTNVSAYTEGYAVYAQYEALRYLKDVDFNVLEAIKENELTSYCVIVLADIGIHYDGWSLDEFTSFVQNKGLNMEGKAAEGTYRQLQANPCAFESYYVGYEEIMALKEEAQQKLGNRFSSTDFHQALLRSGSVPFEMVQENVDEYIKSAK